MLSSPIFSILERAKIGLMMPSVLSSLRFVVPEREKIGLSEGILHDSPTSLNDMVFILYYYLT